ncbi:MAG: hypothetical protein BWY04_00132 [candidate division CPR1 bacterium ADurb.Bin160]|uniref:Uncharacterized protein n=1 Tax=candidate division CPR1 bacterium ADurb.Bin160 TaxID=1852826 RepID=A0A1V5ZRI5_9BACT|nr:MAG: hypothetical protein BWY04_00132 [candidate division CPR1 bacterium ADurb.Bin160]
MIYDLEGIEIQEPTLIPVKIILFLITIQVDKKSI